MSFFDTVEICRNESMVSLCRLRIADASLALMGELDVFIQAAHGKFFERITIQRPDRFIDYLKYPGEINSCTWHGNYLLTDGKIKEPKIHLKGGSKKLAWTTLDGVIDQENIFLFPVFSLYVPENFTGSRIRPKGGTQKFLVKSRDCRIDFYLLPKDIEIEDFLKLTISTFYLNYDITIFNRQLSGALIPLDNCDLELKFYKLKSWWAFIRVVYPQLVKITQYWIYFHDTFDPISCILDRGYAFPASTHDQEDQQVKPQGKFSLRDLHEKELLELGLKRIRKT